MDRKKLEKNIASNLTIDLDVEKFIEVTLLDIEQYANQRVIEELEKMMKISTVKTSTVPILSLSVDLINRIEELKQ